MKNCKVKAIMSTVLAVATVFTGVASGVPSAVYADTTTYIQGNVATATWAETIGDSQGAYTWNYDLVEPVNTAAQVLVYQTNVKEDSNAYWSREYVKDATTGKYYASEYLSVDYNEEDLKVVGDTTAASSCSDGSIYASNYEPGTYNVVLYSFDAGKYVNAKNAASDADTIKRADYYTITSMGQITVAPTFYVSTVVAKNSIQLNMSNNDIKVTGYTIYRKNGSKYVKLATTTATYYVDKGLAKNKKYNYKVVPYFINDKGVKTEGVERKVSAATAGSTLNLQAAVTSKKGNAVKLSWNKITGATKYNIYRVATDSVSTTVKNGVSNSYSANELIKTVKKSAKSYTDKKAEAGRSYTYVVMAVLDGNSTVTESVNVTTEFTGITNVYSYTNSDGSETVTWAKNPTVDGYYVYQKIYDPTTKHSDYKIINTLSSTTTKVSLPAVAASVFDDDKAAAAIVVPEEPSREYDYTDDNYYYSYNGKKYDTYAAAWKAYYAAYNDKSQKQQAAKENNQVSYCIRAYKGTVVSNAYNITLSPVIASVASVSASVVANGIQVTWSEVPGATGYRVYRIKEDSAVKYTNSGELYVNANFQLVNNYVGVTALTASIDSTAAEPKYNQNYSYVTDVIPAGTTTVLDYAGYIARASNYYDTNDGTAYVKDAAGNEIKDTYTNSRRYIYEGVKAADIVIVGPKTGCSYQYVVEAIYDADYDINASARSVTKDGAKLYYMEAVDPATNSEINVAPYMNNVDEDVASVDKAISKAVTITATTAPAKPVIKSVSAKKTAVTVTLKSVASGTTVKIYRATKKKGTYTLVGTTTSKKFVDKTVSKGTTYYYKAVAVKANEAGADVVSGASKVKSVKVKK